MNISTSVWQKQTKQQTVITWSDRRRRNVVLYNLRWTVLVLASLLSPALWEVMSMLGREEVDIRCKILSVLYGGITQSISYLLLQWPYKQSPSSLPPSPWLMNQVYQVSSQYLHTTLTTFLLTDNPHCDLAQEFHKENSNFPVYYFGVQDLARGERSSFYHLV